MLDKKYRPKKLSEVIGNQKLMQAIKGILEREPAERPRTYLLQGKRGCGKTTLARILARRLGAKGGDIREINIADMRGIDTARALIRQLNYTPLYGESTVIVLNEVHQAEKTFQNTMLEILEEPPPNVYFILCTTNPEKLIPTVVSRCALKSFEVHPLTRSEAKKLIRQVLEAEGKEWGDAAVNKVAKVSGGIPREILLLMDSLIGLPEEDIEDTAGSIELDQGEAIDVARALLKDKKWKEVGPILKTIKGGANEAEEVRRVILDYMTKVLLDRKDDRIAFVMDCYARPFYDTGMAGLALATYKAVNKLA